MYKDESEISGLVRSFENVTISRDAWKHEEHLVVALHYITLYDIDTATEKMRHGILNLLQVFEVDLKKEMPYHETLTIFWMRTIADFNASKNGASLLDKTNNLIQNFDKNYPLQFYSKEYLFSDEAKTRFVHGDLNAVDSAN